ncbi:MAG: glycosyltransferase [Pseudomonadales bacterium]|nr:glycosyltransferase [Pseudomonadales bacterium]
MSECVFAIFPSCSEAEASSVLNLMANGLIPIMTKETGISVGEFGFLIEGFNDSAIEKAVSKALTSNEHELLQRSAETLQTTRMRNSIENYTLELEDKLRTILEE